MSYLKVFSGRYMDSGSWGYYKDIISIVVANTEKEALGLCLENNVDTSKHGWSFEEIATDVINYNSQYWDES